METQATGNKLHPLIWVAAIAVILLSAAGIGAIFGVIPTAGSSSRQAEPVAAAMPAPTQAPVAAPAPATKPVEQAAPEAKPAPAPKPKVAAKSPEAKPAPAPIVEPTPAPAPAAQAAPVAVQPPPVAPAICMNCGIIDSVREIEQKGEGTGLGAVAGGVGGAILGSQVGKGSGKTAATVIGTVGGAVAGHQVEKHVRSTKKYEVLVRFEDGASRTFMLDSQPSWRIGDRVKVENNVIMAR